MNKRIKFLNKSLDRWPLKGEEGSFTIEASLVFPLLFIVLLLMLLFGMYMYQKTTLYYVAAVAAERTAFRWDNSYRDAHSAMAPLGKYDSLYWRLSSDGAIQSLFFDQEDKEQRFTIPIGSAGHDPADDALAARKMRQIAARIPASYEGSMKYSFGFFMKEVAVELQNPLSVRSLEALGQGGKLETGSRAVVVDPAEFIRNVDLVRYYSAKLKQMGNGAKKYRKRAAEILNKQQVSNPKGEGAG
ncbi:TadE/TadG family type IV pilus assembly protein [Paenibacillus sp. GCM10027626]|uniref:TadE/TadG family type IV pilus assembly protein n=1 Tax=Paenibacillus sp. GCM10027626 TaxID=3273411 RepID=UPI00364521E5